MKELSCGANCGHTKAQHRAFDRGVAAGEAGKDEDSNPYTDESLSEDWLSGHSVGAMNFRSEKGEQPK